MDGYIYVCQGESVVEMTSREALICSKSLKNQENIVKKSREYRKKNIAQA